MDRAAAYTLQEESGGTFPPALPIKQRRSRSSSSSTQDLELNMGDLHLSGPQTPLTPFTEVFTPTDCNAVHCPIHHRYEYHQARFFSDQTPPPPVPKKSLKRTLSLPANASDPPYLVQSSAHNYENPLYMITPFQDQPMVQEEQKEELHEGLSLQQVTFDTPDEDLNRLFRSFQSSEQISTGILECYLQFLRNTLQSLEMSIFLNEEENDIIKSSQPHDFLLCGQQWAQRHTFYMVSCPKVPRRLFAAKVQRENFKSERSVPLLHPNIEQVVIHFPQCTATNQTHGWHSESFLTVPEASHGGSTEACQQQTVVFLLEKGIGVTMVRDFPLGTLEDFIEEGRSLHCTYPEVYERRLCLLVLQLVLGLQHLGRYSAVYRELKPQSLMLVWPSVMRKVVDTGEYPSGMKKRDINLDTSTENLPMDQLHNGKTKDGLCQTMWERWGTPRLVLSNFEGKVFKEEISQEHQLGDLLSYCLHLPDSGSSLWKVPRDTPYSPGLHWLVNQLMSEKPMLLLADVASVLQVLLWGPRKGFFQQNQLESFAFSNWLILKQSLLVLKLAEKGLFQDQPGLDWEDYLCLQYLSFTDPETICTITAHMGLHKFCNI